jgi:hypothetical protein
MAIDCPSCGAALPVRGRRGDDEVTCDRCGTRVRTDEEPPQDDDRPRRRRRRARPAARPQSGNGRVLVVLTVVGLLFLLACGGVAGLVYWAGQPKWQEFKSAGGGYSIDLPAAPRQDMAKIAGQHGPVQPGVTYEGTILVGRLEEYSIVFADIAPMVRATSTDEQLLDEMVKGMDEGEPPVKVRSSRAITVSGFPGRELDLDIGGQQHLARVVVAKTRLYTLVAGGPLASRAGPRARRFIDSFKVTDPRLLNAANEAEPPDARPFAPRRR